MNILSDKDSIVKVYTTISALLLFLNAFTNVLSVVDYTCTIVSLYLGTLALIVALLNVSPFILETYLIRVFPYLNGYLGRAIFYLAICSLCFGEEMGLFGKINGITMIISAFLCTYLHFFAPIIPPSFNAQHYQDEI